MTVAAHNHNKEKSYIYVNGIQFVSNYIYSIMHLINFF